MSTERIRVRNIRNMFSECLRNNYFVTDKSGVRTLELTGISFLADEDSIFGEINQEYVERELKWYMSMSRNVNDIPGGAPEIWKRVADKDGYINSNYGWCMFSSENENQYQWVLDTLENNPNSRQAIAIYTRPSMHLDSTENGRSDFMCTNTVQYLIRSGCLHVIVNMRSNDVIFGYRNDRAFQVYIAEMLCDDLGISKSNIFIDWQVGSLHIYERHFWMVEAYIQFRDPKMSKQEYMNRLHLYYR